MSHRSRRVRPPTNIDALRLRSVMGRNHYRAPVAFGPDGWSMSCVCDEQHSVIVTCAPYGEDRVEWVHASVACATGLPTYDDLVLLHKAVYGDGFAYQQFVPKRYHVNIHSNALHLFGRLDGKPVVPYATGGTI